MAVSHYEQQALDWAARHGVAMTAKLDHHGRHWPDDPDTLDIYEVELRRGGVKMALRFGQSLNDSAPPVSSTGGAEISPHWQRERHKAERSGDHCGQWTRKHKRQPPTLYDIIACITKSDPGTFADFCGDFGYSTGSMKAKATYEACLREYHDFIRLCDLNKAMIEEAQEIS